MNWKIMSIIAATAIATAAAVVFVLQKQNTKRKMRFDSSEFDDDDFMDDIACAEQCNFVDDSLDIDVSDASEKVEETAEAAADDAIDAADDEIKD